LLRDKKKWLERISQVDNTTLCQFGEVIDEN